MEIGDRNYKVHTDGFNNLDYWTGKTDKSARNHFFYYYESSLTAIRVGPWKMHFATKERLLWRIQLAPSTIPFIHPSHKVTGVLVLLLTESPLYGISPLHSSNQGGAKCSK
jgi:hypothetical protein